MIENKNAGHIAGFIDPDVHLVDASCPNVPDELEGVAVYLFEAGSPVEDLQITEGVGPVSTALVTYENEAYQYAFGFLDAGEYVLVLTCDAELDDLEADDDIVFISTIEQVYVEAKITTWVDFD